MFMKQIATIVCVITAVLVGSVGVSFASDLPPCEGSYRHNCFGTVTFASGNKYVGEFKDSKQHGQGTKTFAYY